MRPDNNADEEDAEAVGAELILYDDDEGEL